jgi:hypothetical protein
LRPNLAQPTPVFRTFITSAEESFGDPLRVTLTAARHRGATLHDLRVHGDVLLLAQETSLTPSTQRLTFAALGFIAGAIGGAIASPVVAVRNVRHAAAEGPAWRSLQVLRRMVLARLS